MIVQMIKSLTATMDMVWGMDESGDIVVDVLEGNPVTFVVSDKYMVSTLLSK